MWANIANTLAKRTANGFAEAIYWSSSEHDPSEAWAQSFVDAFTSERPLKENLVCVRAVRAFSGMKETESAPSAASAPSRPLTPEEQASLDLSIEQQADLYGKDNIGFVKMLYNNILGRASDDGGLNDWVTALNNGTITLGSVVYNFVFSKELEPIISPASPEEFITFLYKNVLNREQDSEG